MGVRTRLLEKLDHQIVTVLLTSQYAASRWDRAKAPGRSHTKENCQSVQHSRPARSYVRTALLNRLHLHSYAYTLRTHASHSDTDEHSTKSGVLVKEARGARVHHASRQHRRKHTQLPSSRSALPSYTVVSLNAYRRQGKQGSDLSGVRKKRTVCIPHANREAVHTGDRAVVHAALAQLCA